MNPRNLPREASRIGVLASAAYLAVALVSAPPGFLRVHTTLALYGAILLFPHAVAVAYVASSARAPRKPLLLAALATLAYLPAPALALGNTLVGDLFFAAASVTLATASILIARERKASVRISLTLVALTYALTIAAIVAADLSNAGLREKALALTIAYPLTLIYAVTVHSLPSTFGDQPDPRLAPIPHLLAAPAAILAPIRPETALALTAASLLAYIPAARIHRLPAYYEKLRGRNPETPAYKGMKYFLDGHVMVVVSIAATLAATIYLTISHWNTLAALHLLLLGPVLVHIAIHEPMMIPVILGVRHKRLFIREVYPTAILASITWIFSPPIAYMILLAYFLLLIMMTF